MQIVWLLVGQAMNDPVLGVELRTAHELPESNLFVVPIESYEHSCHE